MLCHFARPIRLRFGLRFDSIRFDSIRFGASGDVGGAPEAWETWDYATWGRCLEAGERCPYIILITKEVVLSRKRVSLGVGVIGTGVSLQTTGTSRVLLRIGVCRATREHRVLEFYTGSLKGPTGVTGSGGPHVAQAQPLRSPATPPAVRTQKRGAQKCSPRLPSSKLVTRQACQGNNVT